jgi:hypothetical protein
MLWGSGHGEVAKLAMEKKAAYQAAIDRNTAHIADTELRMWKAWLPKIEKWNEHCYNQGKVDGKKEAFDTLHQCGRAYEYQRSYSYTTPDTTEVATQPSPAPGQQPTQPTTYSPNFHHYNQFYHNPPVELPCEQPENLQQPWPHPEYVTPYPETS